MIKDSFVVKQVFHILDVVGHNLDRAIGFDRGLTISHELREDVVSVLVLLRFEGDDLQLLLQGLRL